MSNVLKVEDVPDDVVLIYKMLIEDPRIFKEMFTGVSVDPHEMPQRWFVPFMPDDKHWTDEFVEINGIFYCLVVTYSSRYHTVESLKTLSEIIDVGTNQVSVSDVISGTKRYFTKSYPGPLSGNFNYV